MKVLYTDSFLSYVKRHLRISLPFLTVDKIKNSVLALIEMRLGRLQCRSLPFVYRIDPSTACNIRCPGCEAHAETTDSKRLLDLEDFYRILDKIKKYCVRASLYDSGEPLLNRHIYKMIRYASDNRIATSMSTNFNLFKEEKHLEALFDSHLTVLQPDLDGITQETYGSYRIGGAVEVVKAGIEAVVQHKKATGAQYPIVEPQIIMFEHLMHEQDAIEDYLNQLGVDKITWKRDDWGFNPAKNIQGEADKPSKRCFWLYTAMMIRPDGNAYPCCGRGFHRLAYGNLLEQSIDDIWNNKYYQFSRKLFTNGPDLPYDPEMERIPCHTCTMFKTRRKMLGSPDLSTLLLQSEHIPSND